MITRCYLEITNICNLDCVFCPKTKREKHSLTLEEYHMLTDRLVEKIKFLYLHLMGEPFLHPQLPEFIVIARQKGFIPILTTNGTLLAQRRDMLDALPHKLQISLHSHEGNGKGDSFNYIHNILAFAKEAARRGCIVVMRLWNEGGYNRQNDAILQQIACHLPQPWTARKDGWKLTDNLYIEKDEIFEWPDSERQKLKEEGVFCYALRNQIGVLADGTVVPCCLDHAGTLNLGNLFQQSIEEILDSPRARAIYQGFTHHSAVEPLCQRCGYAALSKQYRE